MNNVQLIGRLVRDPEVRYTAEKQEPVARFTLAIDRTYGQDKKTDFPGVICFGKTAALVEKYVFKGSQVGVTGRIQTGSYTNKDGQKIYTTDVVAERVEFLGGKEEREKEPEPMKPGKDDVQTAFADYIPADDIPF